LEENLGFFLLWPNMTIVSEKYLAGHGLVYSHELNTNKCILLNNNLHCLGIYNYIYADLTPSIANIRNKP
jgi:hypothetical protein